MQWMCYLFYGLSVLLAQIWAPDALLLSAPPCSSLRLRIRNTGALSSGHMTDAFGGVNSSADWMKVFGACCVVLV